MSLVIAILTLPAPLLDGIALGIAAGAVWWAWRRAVTHA